MKAEGELRDPADDVAADILRLEAAGELAGEPVAGPARARVITDPFFYAVAIPAVLLMGISKGGFGSGAGHLRDPAHGARGADAAGRRDPAADPARDGRDRARGPTAASSAART